MKNEELEKKISKAFSDAVPDVFDRVMRDIDIKHGREPFPGKTVHVREEINIVDNSEKIEGTEKEDIPIVQKKKGVKGRLLKGIFSAAAAAAVAVATVLGVTAYNEKTAVASIVSIDVNPSIEIRVNKDKKVIDVIPRSDDAAYVIDNMDFKGAGLDVAVNAILGSMISKGYLSEIANSILISVDNADPETAESMQDILMEEIDTMIGKETFSGAIMGQVIQENGELQDLADKYGITQSKAQLIDHISKQDPTLKYDDLVSLSINDLNLLKKGNISGISSMGTASDEGYIGAEQAVTLALEDAGFIKDDTNFLRVGMDYENGNLCYDISFHKFEGNIDYDYDYNVEASTGDLVSVEKSIENTGSLTKPEGYDYFFSKEEAKQLAFKLAGVDEGSIYEYEEEEDYDRIAHFDIEFKKDGREYNYAISMHDGMVLKDKWEIEEDLVPGEDRVSMPSDEEKKNYIGEENAKRIAIEHAEVMEVSVYDMEIELEWDNKTVIYEVEFKSGIYDYSYDIDPITGEVVDYELDFDV